MLTSSEGGKMRGMRMENRENYEFQVKHDKFGWVKSFVESMTLRNFQKHQLISKKKTIVYDRNWHELY